MGCPAKTCCWFCAQRAQTKGSLVTVALSAPLPGTFLPWKEISLLGDCSQVSSLIHNPSLSIWAGSVTPVHVTGLQTADIDIILYHGWARSSLEESSSPTAPFGSRPVLRGNQGCWPRALTLSLGKGADLRNQEILLAEKQARQRVWLRLPSWQMKQSKAGSWRCLPRRNCPVCLIPPANGSSSSSFGEATRPGHKAATRGAPRGREVSGEASPVQRSFRIPRAIQH